MIEGLRGMFQNQARTERYNISKSLFACKLAEGSPVSPHVIKMIGYIETLDRLGSELHPDLSIDVILQSLPASYEPFIMNFQMNGLDKTLRVRLVPFSIFLARLPPARLPPARLSACIVSLFGCVHIQSQARKSRRLVACTR
jgi:hypothetical protein